MKTLRIAIFIVVALVQIAAPASMIWKRARTFREGRVWKFRTAPVDPIDALRGRYLSLRFSAEEFPWSGPMPSVEIAYVMLKEDGDGFAVVDQVSGEKKSGDDVVPVDRFSFYDDKGHVTFPFDKFWVSEADASAAETAYFANSRRDNLNAYVTVRVHDGDAAIEDLFINGQPLREYLHGAH
ncbi:MAG: GDYXXLXY domain-containing protein [Chthoniobacterales bacterium]